MGIFEPELYRPFAIGFAVGAVVILMQLVGGASGLFA